MLVDMPVSTHIRGWPAHSDTDAAAGRLPQHTLGMGPGMTRIPTCHKLAAQEVPDVLVPYVSAVALVRLQVDGLDVSLSGQATRDSHNTHKDMPSIGHHFVRHNVWTHIRLKGLPLVIVHGQHWIVSGTDKDCITCVCRHSSAVIDRAVSRWTES